MQLFHNIKSVKTKVIVLALGLVLTSAATGVFAMTRLSTAADSADSIYHGAFAPYRHLVEAKEHLAIGWINLQTLQMAPTPEARATAQEAMTTEFNGAEADFASYVELNPGDPEALAVRDSFKSFRDLLELDGIPLVLSGDLAGFGAFASGADFTTALADYQTKLATLVEAESSEADAAATAARSTADSTRTTLWIVIVGSLGLALAASYAVARAIAAPLRAAQEALDKAAEGDLTARLDVASKDEVGRMATSLNRMLEKTSEVVRAIGGNSSLLASASQDLSSVAQQMGGSAASTSSRATAVSMAAEQVSANVQTVATAAEEMGASIKEIAGSAHEAARVATTAVTVAEATNATVTKLGESSAEIGAVIKVITSIAEQTNLLALNATIEAARAGEAGKGFAVVANEVKELAKETARATDEIGGKIVAIQSDARAAVDAIAEITSVINQINGIQSTIASAVEEQTATTNEIIRSVTEAADGSTEIAASVSSIAATADETSTGANASLAAASDLAQMSDELKSLVRQFTVAPTPPATASGWSGPPRAQVLIPSAHLAPA